MLQKKHGNIGIFGTVEIGHLTHLGIDVAIKCSKGSSLNVEGHAYQALSGMKNFLSFFGIVDNDIGLELFQVYDRYKNCCVSSKIQHALEMKICSSKYNWTIIASGIISGVQKMHEMGILHNDLKENNILLKESFDVTAKIFDFGKCTHVTNF